MGKMAVLAFPYLKETPVWKLKLGRGIHWCQGNYFEAELNFNQTY